jgi:hypothetical protein
LPIHALETIAHGVIKRAAAMAAAAAVTDDDFRAGGPHVDREAIVSSRRASAIDWPS